MSIPVLVRDFNPSGDGIGRILGSIGNILYLSVSDGITGTELWAYDVTGPADQAYMLKELNPGATGSLIDVSIKHNNIIYFTGYTGPTGTELWRTDGTEDGTYMIKDIGPGSMSGTSSGQEMVVFNDRVYFNARESGSNYQLWRTDGTEAGTEKITNFNNPIGAMKVYNNMLYVRINDGVTGSELWRTDGTLAGTELVKDINVGSGSSTVLPGVVYNGYLYFAALTADEGRELWRTDGTSEGTVLVKDIRPGIASGWPDRFVVFKGLIYFIVNTDEYGYEVWRSDGTAEGTMLFKDINPGVTSSGAGNLFVAGDTLLFTANDGVNGFELWRSDGTVENTVMVSNIHPATDNSFYWNYTYMKTIDNNTVYFNANDGVTGFELWKYDVGVTTGSPEPEPLVPLEPTVIAEIESIVPVINDTSEPIIVVEVPVGVLTSGTETEKSQKRTTFLAKLFEDNVALASATGKITMTKEKLLGTTNSVITKDTLVIKKASNTEVAQDTSQLAADEAIYVFMNSGDFTVFSTSAGNLKIVKTSETLYTIYENYVDSNSPVTKTMTIGESSSLGTFTYIIGGVSGQISAPAVAPICFPAGTPVNTNQGLVPIEKLNPDIHTIRNKRIVAITQTRPLFTHIVSIEKDALGKNVPSATTQISKEHCVFYKGKMTRAVDLVNVCKGVVEIPYNSETLYNVLLEKHSHMMINNLVCETLHPDNIMAKICGGKYNSSEQNKICEELTNIIKSNNLPAYKKLYASLK